MKTVIFLISILITFSSCNNDTYNKFINLKPDKLIELKIGENISPFLNAIDYYNIDNDKFLAYSSNNTLYFIDFEKKMVFDSIKMEIDGPNRINMNSFFIINYDEIYIIDLLYRKIFKLNRRGEILNKFSINPSDTSDYQINISNKLNNNVIIIGNKFFIPQLKGGTIGLENDYNFHLCLQLDTNTKEINYLPMTLPHDYYSKGGKDSHYNRIYVQNQFIYNFWADPYLYITKDHVNVKKILINSKYTNPPKPVKKPFDDINGLFKFMIEEPLYWSIIYNKYIDVYYRIVYVGRKLSNKDNIEILKKFKTPFSVIVMNNKFEILDEIILPENLYNIQNMFCSEEGLWISENHPLNPNFDENKLSFRLFKLVKNEN